MKKICLITTIARFSEQFLVPMAEYYRRHTDWEVTLICALDDPEFEKAVPEGVRFIPIPMKRGVSLDGIGACLRMIKVFRKEKFDLIQYCTPNASFYAALAGWLTGVKVRLYCQWGMVYVSLRGVRRWVFKTMEKLICCLSTHVQPDSFGNLRLCHEEGIYPESKGSVVWNGSTCGIDLERYDSGKKLRWRQECRQELELPEDAVVFGFASRITGDKGVNELFTAFRELAEKDPNAYLMMVGGMDKEKSVDQDLYAWAKSHPRVRFLGYRRDVERCLAAMDCYVTPSYREGFGAAIIEAEAMELPIIATDIPGPREAMVRDKTGLMVQPRSAEQLRCAMQTMAADPELRQRCGKAGRSYVMERFEQKRFLRETMEDRKRLMEL